MLPKTAEYALRAAVWLGAIPIRHNRPTISPNARKCRGDTCTRSCRIWFARNSCVHTPGRAAVMRSSVRRKRSPFWMS